MKKDFCCLLGGWQLGQRAVYPSETGSPVMKFTWDEGRLGVGGALNNPAAALLETLFRAHVGQAEIYWTIPWTMDGHQNLCWTLNSVCLMPGERRTEKHKPIELQLPLSPWLQIVCLGDIHQEWDPGSELVLLAPPPSIWLPRERRCEGGWDLTHLDWDLGCVFWIELPGFIFLLPQ